MIADAHFRSKLGSASLPTSPAGVRARRGARALAAAAVAALGLGAPGGAPTASAQSQVEWLNPDIPALRQELGALRAEVEAMRGGGFGGGSGAPVSGDAYLRLDQMETELRRLIGAVEQLQFQQRQAAATTEAAVSELKFRLEALEGGGVADLSRLAPSGDAAFSGGPIAGPAVGAAGLPGGAVGLPGGAVYGGAAAAAGAVGSGVLGEVASTDGRAAPVFDTPRFEGVAPGVGAPVVGAPALGAERAPVAIGAGAGGPAADAAFAAALDSLRAGAFQDAERQFAGFAQSYPGDPRVGDAIYWIGETYYVRGQYDLAARQFLQGFRDHPTSAKAPDSLMKLGMTLAQLNQTTEACATLGEVAARYPDAPSTVLRRAEIESRRAGCS